jgi:proliferating cell nuclear antigen
MKVIFKDNMLLKNIIDLFKDDIVDANLRCTPDGIYLQAMDSSHISMASFILTHDVFTLFECNENIELGINLLNLVKVLKVVSKDDLLGIETYQDCSDTMSVQIKNATTNKEYVFTLKLMNIDVEELQIPPIPDGWHVTLNTDEFLKNVSIMTDFSNTIGIECTAEKVIFRVNGDLTNAIISNDAKCEWVGDLENQKNVTFNVMSRLIKQYGSGKKVSPSIHLILAPDHPIIIRYIISETSDVNMFISPKIIDEDE